MNGEPRPSDDRGTPQDSSRVRGLTDLVERARSLAERAHHSQVDKAGQPYIGHLARVAAAVRGSGHAEAAAWLHDLIEDQPQFEAELLEHFPVEVVRVVRLLTRRPDQPPDQYYAAIAADDTARQVKLADIADNSSPARLALLPEAQRERLKRKYERAVEQLACPTATF